MSISRRKPPSVGVIGGSIAGSATAVLLARAGCAVTLLERGGDAPVDGGAGIGVPTSVFDLLVARDLVDAATPCFVARRFPRLWRTEEEDRYGHLVWDQAGSLALLHWGALHRNLRKRVPADGYRTACAVTALRDDGGGEVRVELGDGRSRAFELVVCADGFRSIGRRTLFPEAQPEYVGYVLWRGVLAEQDLADPAPLEGAVCWPSYRGGHGPFYFVPGADGSVASGRRLVNWGLFLRVTELERAELLVGEDGGRPGALPPDTLAPAREASLKQWAGDVLPTYYADIVRRSAGTFVQAIYECTVPAYRRGRICLAGDAGALARPHTGTGVLKGITDAITLADALGTGAPLDEALARWSEERTASGNALVALGRQLGRALVDELGDPSKMDAPAMQRWSRRSSPSRPRCSRGTPANPSPRAAGPPTTAPDSTTARGSTAGRPQRPRPLAPDRRRHGAPEDVPRAGAVEDLARDAGLLEGGRRGARARVARRLPAREEGALPPGRREAPRVPPLLAALDEEHARVDAGPLRTARRSRSRPAPRASRAGTR